MTTETGIFQKASSRSEALRGSAGGKSVDFPILLIIGYFVVEYVRPPFIEPLRPALLIQALYLVFFFIRAEKLGGVLQDTFFKLFFAMMALMTVHVLIAVNNFWAFQQWKVLLSYLLFAVAFCLFVDTPEKLKAAVSAFVLLLAVSALNRVLGLELPFVDYTGPMGDTNDFALVMNVVAPISFFVGLHHSGRKRLMYWGCCIIFVAANVKCSSRGGFLGMAAVSLIIVGMSRYKVKAVFALLAAFVVFWLLIPGSFKGEIQSIRHEGAESGTGKERIELWKVAWRGFVDHPVIGLGQGNMPLRMPDYQYDESGESFFQREIWFRSVHSVYFTALPELGLVGFSLWLWMLKNLYRKFKALRAIQESDAANDRNSPETEETAYIRQVGYGLIIGVFGYLVTGVFLSAFYYPSLWNLGAMITAAYLIRQRIEGPSEERRAYNRA